MSRRSPAGILMMEVAKYLDAYVSEAEEDLQKMNDSLLRLEENPADMEAINQIFRSAHSLKGNSATIGFEKISGLAHAMEDVLHRLKNRELRASEDVINVLFRCSDALRKIVGQVAEGKKEEYDTRPLLDSLESIMSVKVEVGELAGVELAEKPETLKPTKSVKVRFERLDKLTDLVGEFLINRMRLQDPKTLHKPEELGRALDHLERLTEDLRYEIMQARMVPVGQVFDRFPRMVRDLAKKYGKDINFVMEDSGLELDRTILDEVGSPLIHLLRNSVDHGIEPSDERRKAGKKERGVIKLIARRERDAAVIEVMDDGRGFDLEEVKRVAVGRGIISEEEAATLPRGRILQFPFHPGFSTSKEVTEVSGRGIGLDVVKSKIERLGGAVELESEPGKGSVVRLRLPLSLAIISCLLVQVGGEIYGIPLSNVLRVVKVEQEQIKTIEGNETFIFQNENVPLLRLDEMFSLPSERREGALLAVIIEKAGEKAGLVVDEILGKQESMIKPLDPSLRRVKGFAGTTILGDRRVALILDITTLI